MDYVRHWDIFILVSPYPLHPWSFRTETWANWRCGIRGWDLEKSSHLPCWLSALPLPQKRTVLEKNFSNSWNNRIYIYIYIYIYTHTHTHTHIYIILRQLEGCFPFPFLQSSIISIVTGLRGAFVTRLVRLRARRYNAGSVRYDNVRRKQIYDYNFSAKEQPL